MIYWYLIPSTAAHPEPEISSYEASGSLTDFPRGIFLAYYNKGLVTGFTTKREAEQWRDERVYDAAQDLWAHLPPNKEP